MSYVFRGTVNVIIDEKRLNDELVFASIENACMDQLNEAVSFDDNSIYPGNYVSMPIDTNLYGEMPEAVIINAFAACDGVVGVFLVDDESHRGDLRFSFSDKMTEDECLAAKSAYIDTLVGNLQEVRAARIQ